MSIDGLSLLEDTTGITPVGGTAVVFEDDSTDVANGIHVAENTSGVDYSDRRHATLKSRSPQRQPDGTFSKAKRDCVFTIPFTNAAGVLEYQVVRWSLEIPEECTVAQVTEMRRMLAQWATDAELDNFYEMGSRK